MTFIWFGIRKTLNAGVVNPVKRRSEVQNAEVEKISLLRQKRHGI
jgi:hypothetical protein